MFTMADPCPGKDGRTPRGSRVVVVSGHLPSYGRVPLRACQRQHSSWNTVQLLGAILALGLAANGCNGSSSPLTRARVISSEPSRICLEIVNHGIGGSDRCYSVVAPEPDGLPSGTCLEAQLPDPLEEEEPIRQLTILDNGHCR